MVTLDDIRQLIKEGYSNGRVFHKLVTAAGTPERLIDDDELCAQLLIKALSTNTGMIEVGFDGVTTIIGRGHELDAEDYVIMPIDNVNKIWIDSTVNGEGVSVVVMV